MASTLVQVEPHNRRTGRPVDHSHHPAEMAAGHSFALPVDPGSRHRVPRVGADLASDLVGRDVNSLVEE